MSSHCAISQAELVWLEDSIRMIERDFPPQIRRGWIPESDLDANNRAYRQKIEEFRRILAKYSVSPPLLRALGDCALANLFER
jgi:hypothetical protein